MSEARSHPAPFSFAGIGGPRGRVTMARQRRTAMVYGALCLLGLVPALLDLGPGWQAAGLGLWLPGAGFVAVGGWSTLLFPLVLALFVVSLVAWFWAGMVVAPVIVWLGSAIAAGAMADTAPSAGPFIAVFLVMGAIGGWFQLRSRRRYLQGEQRAEARRTFLPTSLAEVRDRSAVLPDPAARELSEDDLPSVRYLLDRSLQPVEAFEGFNIIDQFQPAALRYQLNHMGFALALVQGAYTPNFRGYLRDAQRNLIDKYLLRRVWDYWIYESCWGHLNFTNFDPARRDNIMLTGWFGMHVGAYMLNSGDQHYAEPGSLTFRLSDETAFPHDIHTLVGSVVDNYARYEDQFCIYPCEPNWMYPICNHYGMCALAVHDRLFGTNYVERILPRWLEKLDSEFTDSSGSIIGLRSQLTGIEFPFPSGEAGYANFAHCFDPERARRLWAIARKEIEPAIVSGGDGGPRLVLPGKGLDAGAYTTGHTPAFAGILMAAKEFGDPDIADAAQRSLDQESQGTIEGGVRRYLGSNLANVNAHMGRLMRTGDFRRTFAEGPAASTLKGPVLTGVRYPDALVSKAFSQGDDLELVLYPGAEHGRQTLTIERLKAGAHYRVRGAAQPQLVADAAGTATLDVSLSGRTEVTVAPA